LGLINVPDGVAGVSFGQIGITATDLALDKGAGASLKYSEANRDTRGSEGGFNDQLFFANTNTVFALGTVDQQPITDKFALNGNASFASDRHSVNAKPNAGLTEGESASVLGSVVNENRSMEAAVNEHGSMVGDSPIGIADFDVSSDLSAPGSERAIAELDILNAERLSLISLQLLPGLIVQQNGLVGVPPLFDAASGLGQSEDQQNQSALQHESSVNSSSATLSRHCWLVKK
jgi:hypothetical protein